MNPRIQDLRRRPHRLVLALVSALLVSALAACGGGGDSDQADTGAVWDEFSWDEAEWS